MSPTLGVFLCLLVTNRAALRCTISILSLYFFRYWSHTRQPYSYSGLTSVLYVFSFITVDIIFRFLLKNPSDLFALLVLLLIWGSQFRLEFMVTLFRLVNMIKFVTIEYVLVRDWGSVLAHLSESDHFPPVVRPLVGASFYIGLY